MVVVASLSLVSNAISTSYLWFGNRCQWSRCVHFNLLQSGWANSVAALHLSLLPSWQFGETPTKLSLKATSVAAGLFLDHDRPYSFPLVGSLPTLEKGISKVKNALTLVALLLLPSHRHSRPSCWFAETVKTALEQMPNGSLMEGKSVVVLVTPRKLQHDGEPKYGHSFTRFCSYC